MSKFDAVYKKIEEALPTMSQNMGGGNPPVTNQNQQPQFDQKIIDELVAAKTPQQVEMALQKMQALQQGTQQKPSTVTPTPAQ